MPLSLLAAVYPAAPVCQVYNITQYLDYHPGGVSILMKGAGKDCTALFNKYHAWVNIEGMLSKCFLGVLVDDTNTSIREEEDEDEDEDEGKMSADAVLRQLEQEEEEEGSGSGRGRGGARALLRVNPGLQNLAAGGSLHDASTTATDTNTTPAPTDI